MKEKKKEVVVKIKTRDHLGDPRTFTTYSKVREFTDNLDPCVVCGQNHDRSISILHIFHIDAVATGGPEFQSGPEWNKV